MKQFLRVIAKWFTQECVVYVQCFLNTPTMPATDPHLKIDVALFTRTLFCGMDNDSREEHIDVPSLLRRAGRGLTGAEKLWALDTYFTKYGDAR